MSRRVIRIGTRGSPLALWQANWVKDSLENKNHNIRVEIVTIKTRGDRILDVPLARVGGKGLFVKEIEDAILSRRIDLAVHSMKDVPTELPSGLQIAAITERNDPRDVLISRDRVRLKDLPEGSRIGTSSLRRQSQLLNIRPDFKIYQLRGNLDTRLRKLMKGATFDAIILASAGIRRMGLEEKVTEYISPEVVLPAIGQGSLGIETRIDDEEINDLVSILDHKDTSMAVRAERAFLKRLEGGCQVPIAAYGVIGEGSLQLHGLVGSVDGKEIIRDRIVCPVEMGEEIGIRLAEKLLERGAKDILDEVYSSKMGQEKLV